jgi:hypothetical protein
MQPSIGRNIGNVVVMHTDYQMQGELRYLEDVILICYYYILVSALGIVTVHQGKAPSINRSRRVSFIVVVTLHQSHKTRRWSSSHSTMDLSILLDK